MIAQRVGIRPPRFEPHVIVAADLIPVRGAEIDVLEAVERKLHREIAAGLPALRMLLVVGPLVRDRFPRFGEARIEKLFQHLA